MAINFSKLLLDMDLLNASDLHLKTGAVPIYRVNGRLKNAEHPALTREDLTAIADKVVPAHLKEPLKRDGAVDFAFSINPTTRFRTNAYYQRGVLSMALRRLECTSKTFDDLLLPKVLYDVANYRRGMVLVTGPTGTGKSTTMAAIVDFINERRREHVITIEDPIEYLHNDKQSIVDQREIGIDCRSFELGLRHALREDPDVILVGEMRDRETITNAIRAGMTGHLVISTLHTINATQTVNRIIRYFPPDEHLSIRMELGTVLKAVVSQRLVPATDEKGRVPCVEVMIVNDLIRKLIREDRIDDMIQVIKNGLEGMQSFDQSLFDLYTRKFITMEVGVEFAEDVAAFKRACKGGVAGGDRSSILNF